MYYIMSIVNNIHASKNEFVEQLKKFIIDNGIIGTAAGVSIALVTKDVIQSLVGDIIIPSIFISTRFKFNMFDRFYCIS